MWQYDLSHHFKKILRKKGGLSNGSNTKITTDKKAGSFSVCS
jgi:hypothetical protein